VSQNDYSSNLRSNLTLGAFSQLQGGAPSTVFWHPFWQVSQMGCSKNFRPNITPGELSEQILRGMSGHGHTPSTPIMLSVGNVRLPFCELYLSLFLLALTQV